MKERPTFNNFFRRRRRRTEEERYILKDDAESEGKRREEPKERKKRVGREERVDFQRGWTGVRASVENVRQRTLRGAVHRWRETLVPHSRKDEKKVWVNTSDIILLGLRDFQDEKADVILKYTAEEARSLKAYGELPESIRVNETDTFEEERDENDDFFDFDDIADI